MVRFGHYNIRDLTAAKLRDPGNRQARAAASIIRKFRPGVLSINEIESADGTAENFVNNFLAAPGLEGEPLRYDHFYLAPTNSGAASGAEPPFDYRGFGRYPGQFGLALFSTHPVGESVRSFLEYPWESLPESGVGGRAAGLPPGFPLFGTNCCDVPVIIRGRTVHCIITHAAVPVFSEWDYLRNADQIKFLDDYISGRELGVAPLAGGPFVIMGDLNSDSEKGESMRGPVKALLENPRLSYKKPDRSTFLEGGGTDPPNLQTKGLELTLDYVLPSADLRHLQTVVFWPEDNFWWERARTASDHFFIYADCDI